jgi:tetratricopeptide (TPR) repeat protein
MDAQPYRLAKRYITKLLLLVATCITTACTPYRLAENDLSLEPMYGNQQKTAKQLEADRFLIDKAREVFHGDMRMAANDALKNGVAAMHARDYDRAIRRFNQAWLLDPSTPQVYESFAGYLVVKGRNEEALQYLQRAHALDPQDARIQANIARLQKAVSDR